MLEIGCLRVSSLQDLLRLFLWKAHAFSSEVVKLAVGNQGIEPFNGCSVVTCDREALRGEGWNFSVSCLLSDATKVCEIKGGADVLRRLDSSCAPKCLLHGLSILAMRIFASFIRTSSSNSPCGTATGLGLWSEDNEEGETIPSLVHGGCVDGVLSGDSVSSDPSCALSTVSFVQDWSISLSWLRARLVSVIPSNAVCMDLN